MASIMLHAIRARDVGNAIVRRFVSGEKNYCLLTIKVEAVDIDLVLPDDAAPMAQVAADALNDAFALTAKKETADA